MFTGIVEETGRLLEIQELLNGKRFIVQAKTILEDVKLGDSIAVCGTCQTVEKFDTSSFEIFSIPETLALTNFKTFEVGKKVNLERALRLSDRIGGHLVQGHVEGTALVVERSDQDGLNIVIRYESPYVTTKGSVCLDGISLTVHEKLSHDLFRVQIIPETIRRTNIADWIPGYRLNIETDYIIKSLDQIHQAR